MNTLLRWDPLQDSVESVERPGGLGTPVGVEVGNS